MIYFDSETTLYPHGFVKPIVEPAESGNWRLATFDVSEDDAQRESMIATIQRRPHHALDAGTYLRLKEPNGDIVMSSTPAECWDHQEALLAHGKVLVAGLGIGLVLGTLLAREDVTEIVVVELNQEVIDMVWPYYKDNPKVTLVHQDIHTFEIDDSFDYCWFDIWYEIQVDNLEVMGELLNRAHDAGAKAGCWSLRYLAAICANQDDMSEYFEDVIDDEPIDFLNNLETAMLDSLDTTIYSYEEGSFVDS